MIRPLSIRARLTLWYLLTAFVAVVLFGVISYIALYYALLKEKKTHLIGREQRLIRLLEENRAHHVATPLNEQLSNYALVTHEGNLFQLRRQDGSEFFANDPNDAGWAISDAAGCSQRHYALRSIHGDYTMVLCHDIELNGTKLQLYQGGSLNEEMDILHLYLLALISLMPLLLLVASLCGYFLGRRAMRPVERLTSAALGIGIGNLSARVPLPAAHDEIWQLAEAWNQLLARLESAVGRLSQFCADVSHDLRTSITIMLATAELTLQKPQSEEEHREVLRRIVGECCTATTLLDALLSVARSKNFVYEAGFEQLDLGQLVLDRCRRMEDVAEAKNILFDWDLPQEPVYIHGNETLLNRLLSIFLDNAVKYTGEGGEIRAAVCRRGKQACVTIQDTGVGIAPNIQERIFERYYQADLREKKAQTGQGLGLSIARWIADAHQANITLESTPESGSCFQILFPVENEDLLLAAAESLPTQGTSLGSRTTV